MANKRVNKFEQTYLKTVERAKKHLHSSDIILDYACGTGIITNGIAGNVKAIHAIDISSKMIEVAQKEVDTRPINNI